MSAAGIRAVYDEIANIEKSLKIIKRRLVGALIRADAAEKSEQDAVLKHPNGRLTEAGIAKLREMVDRGIPDSEIARELGITQPAVINQRRNKQLSELTISDL